MVTSFMKDGNGGFFANLKIKSLIQAVIICIVGTSYHLFLLVGSALVLDKVLANIVSILIFNYIYFSVTFYIFSLVRNESYKTANILAVFLPPLVYLPFFINGLIEIFHSFIPHIPLKSFIESIIGDTLMIVVINISYASIIQVIIGLIYKESLRPIILFWKSFLIGIIPVSLVNFIIHPNSFDGLILVFLLIFSLRKQIKRVVLKLRQDE